MKKIPEYYGGKIKPLIEVVARMVAAEPKIAQNMGLLHASLAAHVPGYGEPATCYNCKRSMKITVYTADILDALLIMAMARQVKKNLATMEFTQANKVYVPGLIASQGILKRQTKCDYLGLVKQPENWRGSGYWLLTGWAYKALRGEEIPKSVKYWEGHLIGRSDETTTLSEMFRTHTDLVKAAIAKHQAVRSDYRTNFDDYNPGDWAGFGGYIQNENEN